MRHVTPLFAVCLRSLGACLLAIGIYAVAAHAQKVPAAAQPPAREDEKTEAWKDPLGRNTPRGTVVGFLDAARAEEYALAAQFLDARGARAETLARDLFAVLDARLPGRLMRISDAPEGSPGNVLTPSQEVVGTIDSSNGKVDIVLQRVTKGDPGPIWLFSARTLDAVPALAEEIARSRQNAIFPEFLIRTRFAGTRLLDYLAILFGLPLVYLVTVLLNRALTPPLGFLWSRLSRESESVRRNALPAPVRLLLLVGASGWLLSLLPLSLTVRHVLANVAVLITIVAVAWLLVLLNGEVERHIHHRFPGSNVAAAASLLRVVRRVIDTIVVFVALFVVLRRLGIDPTPALAGLGVGGIAVALAAQKTLENVVAGASIVFDQAVRVGDSLKVGEIVGTVDHIGLRSTRIRTLDRTVVSVPNSQLANANLETFSRDKFWFHPVVGLRYETTPDQLRAVVDGIKRMLDEHPLVDADLVRVRFFRLGSFSLDVDVFAYLLARDWNHFLEVQEQLLFNVTEIVSRCGTSIAFPSQTMYVANTPSSTPPREPLAAG